MAKKTAPDTELTPVQANAAAFADHFDKAGTEMPGWIDPAQHRMGEFGIYDAAGNLLDEDGLPKSGAARALLRDRLIAELAADAPAADAALADPQA